MSEPVVRLMVVSSAFQARVVAARLGVDGIPVQLTGSVDGPCPMGTTTLWVLSTDENEARGLLLIDEAEWCLAEAEGVPEAEAAAGGATGRHDKARRAGLVTLLLAVPLVGMAATSWGARVG